MWVVWVSVAGAKGPQVQPDVLVQGAVNRGSANGLAFDAAGRLHIANVFGNGITVVDPDTGQVLERLGPQDGVFVPDDLAFAPDGSLWFTNPAVGTVSVLPPGGTAVVVAEGFLRANPVTVSDDGRVFFGQCFAESTGVYEITATGTRPLVEGVAGCASNGMDHEDGVLYTPRWYESRILGLDADTAAVVFDLATPDIPTAVKVHDGWLYWVSQDSGGVYRADLALVPQVIEPLAQLGPGLDNLAFDDEGRLFVSDAVDGSIVELLPDGSAREVMAGGMIVPMGIVWVDGEVFVGEPQSIRGFDPATGAATSHTSSVFGVGGLAFATGVHPSPTPGALTVTSWVTGQVQTFEPATGAVLAEAVLTGAPAGAVPFEGDLLVAQPLDGTVRRLDGADLSDLGVVASLPGVAGLAVWGDELYATSVTEGTVVLLADCGGFLPQPEVLACGLAQPEGLVAVDRGRWLAVVEAAAGELTWVSTRNGKTERAADGLVFEPNPPGFGAYWFNGVTADPEGVLYVNADGENRIYRLLPD
jgi:sugar lactone lactonase YvrE